MSPQRKQITVHHKTHDMHFLQSEVIMVVVEVGLRRQWREQFLTILIFLADDVEVRRDYIKSFCGGAEIGSVMCGD